MVAVQTHQRAELTRHILDAFSITPGTTLSGAARDGAFSEASGDVVETLDPTSGELLARVRAPGPDEYDAAVRSAQAAFERWRTSGGFRCLEGLHAAADVHRQLRHGFAAGARRPLRRRMTFPWMSSTEAPTRPDVLPGERTERKESLLRPWSVILHNDDHNDMIYVVRSLMKTVPNLGPRRATQIMFEAHNHGKAVVTTCPLELAELYRDRLQSFGLTATIEKA